MGVSVRLSKNTRIYLPFWVAIPAWLLIAAAYLVVFVIYGVVWLIVQGGAGIGRLGTGRRIRPAAPAVGGTSGRDVLVNIVSRADAVTPNEAQAPRSDAAPKMNAGLPVMSADAQRLAWPQIRLDGPVRPWQRDWALLVLILAFPAFIVGILILSLGPVGMGFGLALVIGPVLAAPVAVIALLARLWRKWRAGRTHPA